MKKIFFYFIALILLFYTESCNDVSMDAVDHTPSFQLLWPNPNLTLAGLEKFELDTTPVDNEIDVRTYYGKDTTIVYYVYDPDAYGMSVYSIVWLMDFPRIDSVIINERLKDGIILNPIDYSLFHPEISDTVLQFTTLNPQSGNKFLFRVYHEKERDRLFVKYDFPR